MQELVVTPKRPLGLTGLLLVAALVSLAFAMVAGSDGVRPGLFADALSGSLAADDARVVLELRLPRALSAFAVGGLLAVAGVLMQVLLRNPLADPYVLGTSGGAAFAALAAILAGFSAAGVDAAAFVGAAVATVIVFGIGGLRTGFAPTLLLLTGVVLASGFGAGVSLLLAVSPDATLRGMLFWLMGDFSLALSPTAPLTALAAAVVVGLFMARALDVLAQSHERALLLGLPLTRMRISVLLFASLLTAYAVTQAGSIGFVGLVVPHLVRGFTGVRHAALLPASAVAGGCLLVIADTLSRTVFAPRQLPVGTLTALIGVPLFLYLLRQTLPARER
ncbi:MAG: iron ABC transporter permease [Pseudomonadota bacterium]